MKLQEGNVFSPICLSFCPLEEGSHVAITHDALDLTVQVHLFTSEPPPRAEIWWLFK